LKYSIRSKLIGLLLVATIIPFSLSIMAIYFYTKNKVTANFVENNHQLIVRSGNDLMNYYEEIHSIPLSIYSNQPFLSILENSSTNIILQNFTEVNRSLLGLYFTRKEIKQLHLYLSKGKDDYTVYNAKVSSRGKLLTLDNFPQYNYLLRTKQLVTIEPTHSIQNYNQLSDFRVPPVKQVMSFHYYLTNVTSDKWLGFLSIDIDLSRVKEIFDRIYKRNQEQLYVVSGEGNVLYSSNENLIGKQLNTKWYKKIEKVENQSTSFDWKDPQFEGVYVFDHVYNRGQKWTIIKRIPFDVLYKDANNILEINLFIGMISVIFIILLTVVVSYLFTRPIKILIQNMKKIEGGELAVSYQSLGNDEFEQLGQHFKSMVDTINELYIKEYKLQIENKTNQLKVLQSQINPHFLYNSLQSIGTLSLKNDGRKVYQLLMSLSKIMRYSMKNTENFVMLSDEINYIKEYLLLQSQRYDGKFEYELLIEEQLQSSEIPKMLLQPIIENYFKHGFETQDKAGKLVVSAKMIDRSNYVIEIVDNGIGLTTNQLQDLQMKLMSDEKMIEDHIGLKNIYERLQLYYGNQSSIMIDSKEQLYFKVTIKMPLKLVRGDQLNERTDY
jgi:two-component system sensor histidine kinase YesM